MRSRNTFCIFRGKVVFLNLKLNKIQNNNKYTKRQVKWISNFLNDTLKELGYNHHKFLISYKLIQNSASGAVTKFFKNVGWAIDKFRSDNSLAINGAILRFAYQKIDAQRGTFANFWDFSYSYHHGPIIRTGITCKKIPL